MVWNMKKIFFSILFLFLSIEQSLAKEVRTRFGFYINLPNNYLQLTANIDEMLKKDVDDSLTFNKEYFNEMMSGSARSDLNIEYYFPKKKYNAEKNMIYIMVQSDLIFNEILDYSPDEICQATSENLGLLYNKKIKIYDCKFNPKFIDRKNSSAIFYIESDGYLPTQKIYMVMLEMSNGFTSNFVAGCEIKNCDNIKKDMFAIVNSREE